MIHQLVKTRRAAVSESGLLTKQADLSIFPLQVIGAGRATPAVRAFSRHSTLRLPSCAIFRGPVGYASVSTPANEN